MNESPVNEKANNNDHLNGIKSECLDSPDHIDTNENEKDSSQLTRDNYDEFIRDDEGRDPIQIGENNDDKRSDLKEIINLRTDEGYKEKNDDGEKIAQDLHDDTNDDIGVKKSLLKNGDASEKRNSMDDLKYVDIPIDRGWAWMIVFGAFCMHVVVVGGCKSFGVLYVEFQDKYDVSAGALSTVMSLPLALMFALGVFANVLAARFTCRLVVFVGGLLGCLSFFLTAFMSEFVGLVFTFGIMTGIAFAMSYSPCVVMVGQHFRKYRSLANGISVAGSGVGTFAIPNLIRVLMREYSLQGCLLIFSGIILNLSVFAMLFRPWSSYRRKTATIFVTVENEDDDKIKNKGVSRSLKDKKNDGCDLELDEIMLVESGGTKTVEISSGEPKNETDRMLPNESQEEAGGKGDDKASSNDKRVLVLKEKNADTDNHNVNYDGLRYRERTSSFHSYTSTDNYTAALQAFNDDDNDDKEKEKERSVSSLVGNGKSLKLSKSDEGGESRSKKKKLLDWTLLFNPIFLMFALANCLATPGYAHVFVMLPDYAEARGQDRDTSALITSIIGISDLAGRLFFGWFSDLDLIPKRWGFIGCMASSGVLNLLLPSLTTFPGMVCYAIVFGFFSGSFITLTPVLLAEELGTERLGSSFGLNALFMAVSVISGPPICGSIKDATGSWDAAFYFVGALTLVGASLPAFRNYGKRWNDRREERKRNSPVA